jgi:MFS family permease
MAAAKYLQCSSAASVYHGAMWNRNLAILLVSQIVAVSGTVLIVIIGGLVGALLSSNPAFATLPLSIMVLGTACATVFAAMLMRRIGRRFGFAVGAAIACIASLAAAFGLYIDSFASFCAGVGLYGVNNAFVQQYRFAAAESVAPAFASRAISFVMLGAIGGAFCGPVLATLGQSLIVSHLYMGSMVAVGVLQALAILLLLALEEPVPTSDMSNPAPERSLRTIVLQPTFVVAVFASVVGYGVMNLVMTATPLSMHVHDGLSLDDTAWVIQSHVLAMYVPSFFSGILIARLGVVRILLLGVFTLLATVVFGLQGHAVVHYWWALVLLGIGWNFLFVGGTSLLVDSYRPDERFKAQAVNEFSVFGVSAAASLLAGTLINNWGWNTVLWSTAPFLIGMLLVLIAFSRRPTSQQLVPGTIR